MNSVLQATIFLINTLFGLYLMILGIRLILAWERANYFNPIIRFIITMTQPLIGPVRKVIPNIGRLETATLVWMILLEIIKFSLILLIANQGLDLAILPLSAVFAVIILLIQIFFFAILIFAILSWIHTGTSPLMQVLAQLSAPVLRPLQKVIPLISGFDVSPLVALILLQVLLIIFS